MSSRTARPGAGATKLGWEICGMPWSAGSQNWWICHGMPWSINSEWWSMMINDDQWWSMMINDGKCLKDVDALYRCSYLWDIVSPLPSSMPMITRHCQEIYVNSTMILTVSAASFYAAPELALDRPVGFETAHTSAMDRLSDHNGWQRILQKPVSKYNWDDGMDCACGWVPAFMQTTSHAHDMTCPT